jgi:hypothetical protein
MLDGSELLGFCQTLKSTLADGLTPASMASYLVREYAGQLLHPARKRF